MLINPLGDKEELQRQKKVRKKNNLKKHVRKHSASGKKTWNPKKLTFGFTSFILNYFYKDFLYQFLTREK